jgi:hypothetical protein
VKVFPSEQRQKFHSQKASFGQIKSIISLSFWHSHNHLLIPLLARYPQTFSFVDSSNIRVLEKSPFQRENPWWPNTVIDTSSFLLAMGFVWKWWDGCGKTEKEQRKLEGNSEEVSRGLKKKILEEVLRKLAKIYWEVQKILCGFLLIFCWKTVAKKHERISGRFNKKSASNYGTVCLFFCYITSNSRLP